MLPLPSLLPFSSYLVGRHTSLTRKSKILRESTFRAFAGWSTNSGMPQRYIHYFGNEGCESVLQAYGILPKSRNSDTLMTKLCPNCSEPNKPESKFCAKCRMVLTYDAYSETIEEKKRKESEIKELKEKYEQDMIAMRGEIQEDMKQQMLSIERAQKETRKQLDELLKYRSITMRSY